MPENDLSIQLEDLLLALETYTKKLIKLYKERGTVAIYGGDCISPLKLVKHQQIKLESENGKFSYTTDFITLYSVEQDMYTLYIPHSIVNKTFLSFIFNGLFSC